MLKNRKRKWPSEPASLESVVTEAAKEAAKEAPKAAEEQEESQKS